MDSTCKLTRTKSIKVSIKHYLFGIIKIFFRNKQKEERALRRAKKKLGKEKKYKTVKRKMRRKATKTVTKVVQEQVMNDDTGEQEMVRFTI